VAYGAPTHRQLRERPGPPMRKAVVVALLLAASCSSGGAPTDKPPTVVVPLQHALDTALTGLAVDGAAVQVVERGGTPLTVTSGVSDRSGTPVEGDTKFAIASVTKTFTTVVALRLAERHVVDLDAPVHLDGLQPDVTLRDLLGHTSGLPRGAVAKDGQWTSDEFATAAALPGGCEPRRCFLYSDLGFVAAGVVLEQLSGTTFSQLLDREVLARLGLHDTVLLDGHNSTDHVALADRHDDAVSTTPFGAVPINTWTAGSIVTTAGDLARFGHALFAGDLVDSDSLAQMQDVDRTAALPCPDADACVRPYGLGLSRFRFGGHDAWGHLGSSGAALIHFVENDTTVAVLPTRKATGVDILDRLRRVMPELQDRGDIYRVGDDGSDLQRLTADPALDGGPSWSPDGNHIAFGSVRDGNPEIYVCDLPCGVARRVTNDPADDRAVRWSPDGTTLVFSSDRAGNDDLYLMTVDGTHLRRVTDDPLDEDIATFSPDGSTLVFEIGGRNADPDIATIRTDGSGRRVIAAPGTDLYPTWSPDATMIAFQRPGEGIWTMRADGSNAHRVSPSDRPEERFPSWGPSGRLAFVSRSDVWTSAADGSDRRQLTDTAAFEYGPMWSPTGDALVFTSDQT
jgi:CubicO group peptidase (beta-lactamase class C family)